MNYFTRYKKWLFFILILFINSSLWSQDTLRFAKIKTTNGVLIKGYVVDSVVNNKVILRTSAESVFTIKFDEISKIKLKDHAIIKSGSNSTSETEVYPGFDNKLGFYHLFGIGLAFGEYNSSLSLTNENGYRFNDHFSIGLGANYDRYDRASALPFYVNARGFLHNKKLSPFYYVGGGYAIAWRNQHYQGSIEYNGVNGGVMLQTGLGYQLNFQNMGMVFNLGYKTQKARLQYSQANHWGYSPFSSSIAPETDPVLVDEKRTFRRIELKVALLF